MFLRGACSQSLVIIYLLFQLLQLASSLDTCGSLITYRQYSTLLNRAPQCFRDGCIANGTQDAGLPACAPPSPCSALWTVLETQFQTDWCSSCKGDIACRIPGWPVLNATSACKTTPHNWVFYVDDNCCKTGNQPFELASWIGNMCNQSQWREPFQPYGGMAQADWEEWIVPWNWTVRREKSALNNNNNKNNSSNSSGIFKTTKQSECQRTSLYLGLFALDNFAVVIFAIIEGWLRYKLVKIDDADRERNFRRGLISLFTKRFVRPSGVIWTLAVGAIWSGTEIGVNFANAYYIKHHSGFSHVPLVELALLFCSRPSISWIPCFLGFLPDRNFHSHQAQAVFADIAYTSAFREFVMQVIGGVYLGRTGNVGRQRGFYLIHHLRPYIHGRDAFRMYLGALFWLIGCAVIIPLWLIVILMMVYDIKLRSRWEKFREWTHKQNRPEGEEHQGHGTIRSWLNKHIIPARISTWIDSTEDKTKKRWRRLHRWYRQYIVQGKYAPWARWYRRRHENKEKITREPVREGALENWKMTVMTLMVLVGTASYIAQWLFWDGYVKAILPTQRRSLGYGMGIRVYIR
ncbi:MAG: hypothetical protein M1840_006926 [Geoglossum simile]|nr:MAG: hypothetical protein M1840_006926 [Geoglossum simile]